MTKVKTELGESNVWIYLIVHFKQQGQGYILMWSVISENTSQVKVIILLNCFLSITAFTYMMVGIETLLDCVLDVKIVFSVR